MQWISHFVVSFLQKIFVNLAIPIVKYPFRLICFSLCFVLITCLIGLPMLKVPENIEFYGASSEAGHLAYLKRIEFFDNQIDSNAVIVEADNVLKPCVFNNALLLQKKLESGSFDEICEKKMTPSGEYKCAPNMFESLFGESRYQQATNVTYNVERGDPEKLKPLSAHEIDITLAIASPVAAIAFGHKKFEEQPILRTEDISTLNPDEAQNKTDKYIKYFTLARQIYLKFDFHVTREKSYLNWQDNVFTPLLKELQENPKKMFEGCNDVSIAYATGDGLEQEGVRAIADDIHLLYWSFILMMGYCFAILMGRWQMPLCRHSRFIMGFCMVFTSLLSLLFSYALQGICGIPFSPLSLTAGFVIFGVGIDDAFILIDAYLRVEDKRDGRLSTLRRASGFSQNSTALKQQWEWDEDEAEGKNTSSPRDIELFIRHRMMEAMEEIGDAVSLTTCTDVVCFMLGASIDVPAIRGFCITGTFAVLMIFTLQWTFFAPMLVLDERRRLSGRWDIFIWFQDPVMVKESKAIVARVLQHDDDDGVEMVHGDTSKSPRALRSGSKSFEDVDAQGIQLRNVGSNVIGRTKSEEIYDPDEFLKTRSSNCDKDNGGSPVHYKKNRFSSKLKEKVNSFSCLKSLYTIPRSIAVVVFFIMSAIFCFYYASNHIERRFNTLELIPKDSFMHHFLEKFYAGQDGVDAMQLEILFENIDLNNIEHRRDMQRVYAGIQELNDEPSFKKYKVSLSRVYGHNGIFSYLKDAFRDGRTTPNITIGKWLQKKENTSYRNDFYLYDKKNKIRGLRFILTCHVAAGYEARFAVRSKISEIIATNSHHLDVYAYSSGFSLVDRYGKIRQYIRQSILSSLVAVVIVTSLFTPPLYALASTLCVIFVISNILVIFPLFDITFNALTLIYFILTIGFAVDYSAHIGQCFANNYHLPPAERALHSVQTMASSVFKAGFSTILAVCCLFFSSSVPGQILVKCFTMMAVSGLVHSIIFLPCVLFLMTSIIDCASCSRTYDHIKSYEKK